MMYIILYYVGISYYSIFYFAALYSNYSIIYHIMSFLFTYTYEYF